MKARPASPHCPPAGHVAGFTLIELMIAVAIVGVLAMVALPSMLDSIRKGRRAEAFAAISALQQAQERWRGNNSAYAALSSLSVPGVNSSGNTASGRYSLSISDVSATGYTVTASGVDGTSQANDQCRKLSVQMAAGVVKVAGCTSCSTFSYAEVDPCWAK